MARLWQCGFEQNSSKELTVVSGAAASIQGVVVRTGGFAAKITGLSSGTRAGFVADFTAAANGPYYFRIYFRYDTLPTAENTIIALTSGNAINSTVSASIKLGSDGKLNLYNDTTALIGTSEVLSAETFYRIEIKFDKSPGGGSQILESAVNGLVFATASNLTIANQVASINIGGNLNAEAQTTGTWYFDDLAINDTTGSQQSGYPGDGAILHALPSGAGDNTEFTIGGSAPAPTNWQSVNEMVPDDGVTLVSDNTSNHIDDYTVDSISGIGVNDTINTVAVGIRFAGLGAGTSSASLATRLKAAASGTTDQGVTITSNGVTWFTNTSSGLLRLVYNLVDYFKPGTAISWTKADLTAAQIGVKTVASTTNASQVTAIWLSVDFSPSTSSGGESGSTGSVLDLLFPVLR